MNITALIILGALSLGMVISGLIMTVYGMVPRRTPAKVEDMRVVEPGQLPISPYTGEPYDPAWGTMIQKGGQSNRALLKLIKTIESEIAEQDPPQGVSGIIPYGQAVGDYPDPQASYEEMIISYPEGEREL